LEEGKGRRRTDRRPVPPKCKGSTESGRGGRTRWHGRPRSVAREAAVGGSGGEDKGRPSLTSKTRTSLTQAGERGRQKAHRPEACATQMRRQHRERPRRPHSVAREAAVVGTGGEDKGRPSLSSKTRTSLTQAGERGRQKAHRPEACATQIQRQHRERPRRPHSVARAAAVGGTGGRGRWHGRPRLVAREAAVGGTGGRGWWHGRSPAQPGWKRGGSGAAVCGEGNCYA